MLNSLLHSGAIEIITVAIGGAVGALAKDCIEDNAIMLPHVQDGKLFLGFIGAIIVGSFVGMAFDGNFVTAALAGYTGKSVLENLLNKGGIKARILNKIEKVK
jgi:fluoride ion exporter CrcB/FEX